jgi:hypothetical protein
MWTFSISPILCLSRLLFVIYCSPASGEAVWLYRILSFEVCSVLFPVGCKGSKIRTCIWRCWQRRVRDEHTCIVRCHTILWFMPFRSAGSLHNMLCFIPLVCLTVWSFYVGMQFQEKIQFLIRQGTPCRKRGMLYTSACAIHVMMSHIYTYIWQN